MSKRKTTEEFNKRKKRKIEYEKEEITNIKNVRGMSKKFSIKIKNVASRNSSTNNSLIHFVIDAQGETAEIIDTAKNKLEINKNYIVRECYPLSTYGRNRYTSSKYNISLSTKNITKIHDKEIKIDVNEFNRKISHLEKKKNGSAVAIMLKFIGIKEHQVGKDDKKKTIFILGCVDEESKSIKVESWKKIEIKKGKIQLIGYIFFFFFYFFICIRNKMCLRIKKK